MLAFAVPGKKLLANFSVWFLPPATEPARVVFCKEAAGRTVTSVCSVNVSFKPLTVMVIAAAPIACFAEILKIARLLPTGLKRQFLCTQTISY